MVVTSPIENKIPEDLKKRFGRHLICDIELEDSGVAIIADPVKMRDLAIDVSNVSGMHLVFPPLSTKFSYDGEGSPVELLDDNDKFRVQWPVLDTAHQALKTKNKEDEGVSCGALWVESHFYSHGWNSHKYLSLDMFTCRDFDIEPVIDCIAKFVHAKKMHICDMFRFMNSTPEIKTFTREYENGYRKDLVASRSN